MPTPIIRVLLAGRRTTKVEHSAIRILLAGAPMPTPIIRILLAGGRTAKAEHSAIRILLAGAQCQHQSSEYY